VSAGTDAGDPTDVGTAGAAETDADAVSAVDTETDEVTAIITDPYDRRTTAISRTVTRVVVPIILVTSIALLLQGHNLPGGGFIGGVLTATAFVLVYVIFGMEYLQSVVFDVSAGGESTHGLVSGYRWLFAVGLALAAGSGLVPVLVGLPFLTQGVLFLEPLPLYGELEVASALAFDLGVYFTVVGALLTILGEVGYE
jgi:multicomponent Na+:H+ antiporter subunit B